MTAAEAQALMSTIDSQINGRAGQILGIHIEVDQSVLVLIDWEAFQAVFSGQIANRSGNVWSKDVSGILYQAIQDDTATTTVP